MTTSLTPEGMHAVQDIANRSGVSLDAALTLLDALMRGNGTQAQFSHNELGGMGQWSQGGMIMVGDMFNQGLKYRVDSLCNELSNLLRSQPIVAPAPIYQSTSYQSQNQGNGGGASLFFANAGGGSGWWPSDLGQPSSSGAQNDLRYAFFPAARRLAIVKGSELRVYDTGDHQISGYSQQQGGDQSLTFTSQYGLVRVADLPVVGGGGEGAREPATPPPYAPPPQASFVESLSQPPFASPPPVPAPYAPAPVAAPAPAAPHAPHLTSAEILQTIEGLADLRKKEILTEEEFSTKKAALLSRL